MQPRRRRRVAINTTTRWYIARFNFFRRYISDDVAQYISRWIPLRSTRARNIIRTMKSRVDDYILTHPGISFQDAVDMATSEVLDALTLGLDVEPELRSLISP